MLVIIAVSLLYETYESHKTSSTIKQSRFHDAWWVDQGLCDHKCCSLSHSISWATHFTVTASGKTKTDIITEQTNNHNHHSTFSPWMLRETNRVHLRRPGDGSWGGGELGREDKRRGRFRISCSLRLLDRRRPRLHQSKFSSFDSRHQSTVGRTSVYSLPTVGRLSVEVDRTSSAPRSAPGSPRMNRIKGKALRSPWLPSPSRWAPWIHPRPPWWHWPWATWIPTRYAWPYGRGCTAGRTCRPAGAGRLRSGGSSGIFWFLLLRQQRPLGWRLPPWFPWKSSLLKQHGIGEIGRQPHERQTIDQFDDLLPELSVICRILTVSTAPAMLQVFPTWEKTKSGVGWHALSQPDHDSLSARGRYPLTGGEKGSVHMRTERTVNLCFLVYVSPYVERKERHCVPMGWYPLTERYRLTGLDTAATTVAIATNIVALAQTSMAVAKLWVDFTQIYAKCD